eukprot:1159113-Pelagomonas_calceolata.AAC.1
MEGQSRHPVATEGLSQDEHVQNKRERLRDASPSSTWHTFIVLLPFFAYFDHNSYSSSWPIVA